MVRYRIFKTTIKTNTIEVYRINKLTESRALQEWIELQKTGFENKISENEIILYKLERI